MGEIIKPDLGSRQADALRPTTPILFYQKWTDLAFLHWAYPADEIQATLAPGLHVDTYDGHAWLAIIPFAMHDIRPRFAPAMPSFSDLLEINVRTYVYDDMGRTGVWFYSLDANRKLAVTVGRRLYHLNYLLSEMKMAKAQSQEGREIDFVSKRDDAPPELESRFQYSASNSFLTVEPGSIEYFFLERYSLYAYDPHRERLLRARVFHQPYAFSPAQLSYSDENLFELDKLRKPGRNPDSVLYSPGVDVSIHRLIQVL